MGIFANSEDPDEMLHFCDIAKTKWIFRERSTTCFGNYSKTCLKCPLKNRQSKGFKDKW